MKSEAAPGTEPLPRRGRQLIPAGLPRRREVIAVLVLAIVAGHLAFAPATLVVAIVLAAAGRASRWRSWWLLLPVAAGVAWTLALGPGTALAGFAAWPSAILGSLHGHLAGHPPARVRQPPATLRATWSSLPAQLPIALIFGAAEAAVFGWLAWLHTDEWSVPVPRPGALAAVRGRVTAATIRAGAVVTREGCALGVAPATGAVAELRWTELAGGLLVTGDDSRDVALASLQVVHAALRRRKPLFVIGQSEGSSLDRALAAACLATGTPLHTDGHPVGVASGAGGVGGAAGGAGGEGASRLWGRAREGPPSSAHAVGAPIDPHEVILERSAARLPACSPEAAARACADLTALARHLRTIGVDGDGLIWIPDGEQVPVEDLVGLLREAPAAGLPVLVGTASPAAAADLAGLTGAALIHRVGESGLASRLADLTGTRLLPAPAAAVLAAGAAGQEAGPWPPAMPAMPAMPAVPASSPMAMPPGTTMPPAVPAYPGAPTQPGVTPMAGTDLVRCPVIPPQALRALRPGEFVLAVRVPRRRLIALAQSVPARLPHGTDPVHREPQPDGTGPPHGGSVPYGEIPQPSEPWW